MTWKCVSASVAGTKHQKRGQECQDYAKYKRLDGNVIIGAVSDGAGSAKYAKEAAELAVETAIQLIDETLANEDQKLPQLENGNSPITFPKKQNFISDFFNILCDWLVDKDKLNEPLRPAIFSLMTKVFSKNQNPETSQNLPPSIDANQIFHQVHQRIVQKFNQEAITKNCSLGEFSCTLIAFVATPNYLASMQIGDGFIVVRPNDSQDYQLLFPPEKVGAMNETVFVISVENISIEEHIRVDIKPHKFICVSTDALELAAIDFQTWEPYKPFFQPLEEYMANTPEADIKPDIEDFLNSTEVSHKTADDKTLLVCWNEK